LSPYDQEIPTFVGMTVSINFMNFIRFTFLSVLNLFGLIVDSTAAILSTYFNRNRVGTYPYVISKGKKMKLDLYLPKNTTGKIPLIIFAHGGGWVLGSRKQIEVGVLKQIKRGYAVASISYSLATRAKFPQQIYECKAAVRWLRANAKQFNLNDEKFTFWGASAGGHLSNLVGTTSGTKELEGNLGDYLMVSSSVQSVVSWYAPTDLLQMGNRNFQAKSTDWTVSFYLGFFIHQQPKQTEIGNPLNYIHKKTPPVFLTHGTKDTIVNPNQSELLYRALLKKGIPVIYEKTNFLHGDIRFNYTKQLKMTEDFLDNQ
jgi:acetyl esterase/lipase